MLGIAILENSANYIEKINFSNPTWDIFVFLIFITIAFLYGVFIGRDKIIHILIASFFSFFVVKFNPFFGYIKNFTLKDQSIVNIILFLFLLLLFYFLLAKRSLLSNIDTYSSPVVYIFLFSFLHSGFIISLALNILDKSVLSSFGTLVYNIFISPIGFFCWIFFSILALIFLKGQEEG